MSDSGLRVVLADDDVLLREGLASLLERAGVRVVGQAGDGAQLLGYEDVRSRHILGGVARRGSSAGPHPVSTIDN